MNLHLMPIKSFFNPQMIQVLNQHFPKEENLFVLRQPYPGFEETNCIVDASRFNVAYINAHAAEYHRIILHYNWLKPHEIMRLSDEAAEKIVWIVWGDDLYYVKRLFEPARTKRSLLKKTYYIWSHYSLLYGIVRLKTKKKVEKFHAVGIGYSYDEKMIRKRFGKKVHVAFGPVFSNNSTLYTYENLRKEHLARHSSEVNVMIGHSGFPFHNHEKSLRLLRKFKEENIHINLVLSYGASKDRVKKVSDLAIQLFGSEKVTILTEKLPYADYCRFLASMDIALFPFVHQSALGNTKKLAYVGVKLYLNPKGALAQGFLEGGVKTFDYNKIRKETWEEFSMLPAPPEKNAPLFTVANYDEKVAAWADLLR